jgi:hypothetical protein
MAYQIIPPGSDSGAATPLDAAAYARSLAEEALGVSGDDLLFHFHLFPGTGDLGAQVIVGAPGNRSEVVNQLQRLNSGGAGFVIVAPTYEITEPNLFVAGAAKKFWVGGEFALVASAAAAGEHCGIGGIVSASTENMVIGMRGSTSVTNFVAYADLGSPIDSGLALDTTRRIHQFWRDGTTGNYKIDDLAVVQGNTRPAANCSPIAVARSGAVARSVDFLWFAGAAPRE